MARVLVRTVTALVLLLTVAAVVDTLRPADAEQQAEDFDIPNGHFFTQTGGGGGLGFAITDDGGMLFWSEFQRLGDWPVLGYPISHRFEWDGFVVQATQRVVMQWRPEVGQVYFVNVFDRLSEMGFDDYLLNVRQTPPPMDTSDEAGLSFREVASKRRALLDEYPEIRAAFGTVPGGDPLQSNGLPTSPVTDMGNHFALRAQRIVIQQWKEDVPWARAGEITFALGGQIAAEVGALPDPSALAPAPPGGAPPIVQPTPVPPPQALGADRIGLTFAANELDPKTPRAIELTRQTGAGWLRLHLYWSRVEPSRDRFDFAVYDAFVAKARSQGFQILAVLAYTTNWNTTAPASETRIARREHYPPADYGLWERYVATVVDRYKNDIHAWEVWNEPDLRGFWGGTPAQYAQLLAAAHGAVKRTDPSGQVAMAGLSLGGSPGSRDADFFSKILADPSFPAARYFDVANFHHYGPKAEAKRRMDYMRGELAKVGAADRPIWITEVGYASDPSLQREASFQGTQGQAQWLRDMLPYLLVDLGTSRLFWFTLYDDPGGGPTFATHGLLDGNLNPKPAYDAFRELAASGR